MSESRRPTRPTKKLELNLEIAYDFHPTEGHRRVHWMYYRATGATPEECKDNAYKYYNTQIKSLGWGRITTLKEIKPLGTTNDPATHKANSELSSTRDTSGSGNGKPTSKRRTRKTESGAGRDSAAGTDQEKPRRNRKAPGPAKQSKTSNSGRKTYKKK